jgi:ABC-2 type transport system permease protein
MITLIAKKELKETFRDGRFRITAVIVLLLLIASVFVSKSYYESINTQHEAARKNTRTMWEGQSEKNPHSAAHYGTYAFKPKYPLALIDNGVDKYAGVSIYLEAHVRNQAQYMAAQDQTALARFGDLTPDFILLFIIPLFIILNGFHAFTRERESGTLKLLQSQGVAGWKLATGKWLGLFIPVLLILIPIYVLASIFLSNLNNYGAFSLAALTGLFLIYIVYYAVFTNLTLLISSLFKKSSLAFVALLTLWMVTCLAMPKLSTNLAQTLYSYPTQLEFEEQIAQAKSRGLNGHEPWSDAAKKLEQETLKQYGVDSISQLPFNWDGFLMQKGEEHDAQIYFDHYDLLKKTNAQQSQVYQYTSALSPFLPARFLSMAVCRTDYNSHWAFADAAEKYRLMLVGKMNGDMAENSKTGDWDYLADEKLWASVPEFDYTPPSYSAIVSENTGNILLLALWLAGTFAMMVMQVNKLKVV